VRRLILALLLAVLIGFSFVEAAASEPSPCLDQDVWVYIKHSDPWAATCTVVVFVPKHSLAADFENCPAQDTKVFGKGRVGFSGFAGYHVVTIKKGLLNDSKNYTTKPPRKIKVPANNFNTWHVSK
jgi:hypothetical protein